MNVTVLEPKRTLVPKRIRVAAYARVSVEKETSEHSFKAQSEHFIKLLNSNPLWINAGLYTDLGITGTKAVRPGFSRLIEDCEKGLIDLVITKSVSRFARNTVDLLNTVRHLSELGINVHFERENMDSVSGKGEFVMTLLASFAQEEARSMSENMKWTFRKGFEKGTGNWSHLYGYKREDGNLTIDEHEAEVIRSIYSMYLEGKGPHAIVAELKRMGVTRRDGTLFTYNRIVKVLNQEKYAGNSLLQKTYRENFITKKRMVNKGQLPMYFAEGTHPAIIDQSVLDSVRELKAQRRELGYMAGRQERFSCFTGKIFCAECGRTYRRCNKGGRWKRYIWRCGSKITNGTSACAAQNLPEKLLIEESCRVLGLESFNPEIIQAQVDSIVVSNPCTITFTLKDGLIEFRSWSYDEKTKSYKEVDSGKQSHGDSADADTILI